MNKYIPYTGKLKFKKPRKNINKYINLKSDKSVKIEYGDYGFQAISSGFIKVEEIEACRRAIVKKLKKEGKIWIRCYPYKAFTSKGAGQRMGRGKGLISYWVFPVKKNQILFELSGPSIANILSAFKSVCFKLNVKIKLKKKKKW